MKKNILIGDKMKLSHIFYIFLIMFTAQCRWAQERTGREAPATLAYRLDEPSFVTIVIEDETGRRVRNLVAAARREAGEQCESWDGLDDEGRLVPPGTYRWTGLKRGDLNVLYRGKFQHGNPPWLYGKTGGWLSDHYYPTAIVSLGDNMLIGSGVSEWGHGLAKCDLDGRKIWGVRWLEQMAWAGASALVTDGQRVFATAFPATTHNWVWEVDPGNGSSWPVIKMSDIGGIQVVGARRTGPAHLAGELYVSDVLGKQPRTFVYSLDREPKLLRTIPLRIWGMSWLPDGKCAALTDKGLEMLDTTTGKTILLNAKDLSAPFAIASDAKGRIYVSDRGGENFADYPGTKVHHTVARNSEHPSMQIKIFDGQGHLLAAMGRQGGRKTFGPYSPNDFLLPAGLSIDSRGRLWTTEETDPKRVSVWKIPDGLPKDKPMLVEQFFGPGYYGEGAYMKDPSRPNLITSGQDGITWEVDLNKGTYKPVELPFISRHPEIFSWYKIDQQFPFGNSGLRPGFESPYQNWTEIISSTITRDGRTYQWYSGSHSCYTVVCEKLSSGELPPLSAFGSVGTYIALCGQYSGQWVPPAILEAAKQTSGWKESCRKNGLDPNMDDLPHTKDIWGKWPEGINAFNWTDGNGDGKLQPYEIKLSRLGSRGGSVVYLDRQLNALVSISGNLSWMKTQGFNRTGAPIYDWTKAEHPFTGSVGAPTYVGEDGSLLITPMNGQDNFCLIDSRGRQTWSYPASFSGHNHRLLPTSDLSKPGKVYGAWNMQGVVEGPRGLGPVFMLHGGHGMNYLFTLKDGLFIGTIFTPARYKGAGLPWDNIPEAKPGMRLEEYSLQDECFNGSIARAEANAGGFEKGHYYLLGLGRRVITELSGLDSIKRLSGGKIAISRELVEKRRQELLSQAEKEWDGKSKSGDIPYAKGYSPSLPRARAIRDPLRNWDSRIAFWQNGTGLGIGATFHCPGDIPLDNVFINGAPKWEDIIAYGDCVDLQVCASSGGVQKAGGMMQSPGDQRLVFAYWNGKLTTVRYRWMQVSQSPEGAKVLQDGRQGDFAWVADRVELPGIAVDKSESPYGNSAVFTVTIPWSALGVDYKPGMVLRLGACLCRRLPPDGCDVVRYSFGGEPGPLQYDFTGSREAVHKRPAIARKISAVYDLATALEMHPALCRLYALRPEGYVFPPDVEMESSIEAKDFLPISVSKPGEPVLVKYANGSDFTWISGDHERLNLKWYVSNDANPFVNNGADWTLLFKTGDAVDLQVLSQKLGKCRYLISVVNGKPAVVRYRYGAKGARPEQGVWYRSPVGEVYVPVVEELPVLKPKVLRGKDFYTVELGIPWSVLGIEPKPGLQIPAEFGILRSDPTGSTTVSRDYWHSGLSGMVQDVPNEVKPTDNWGTWIIQK